MKYKLFTILLGIFIALPSLAQKPSIQLWHLEANSSKGNSGIGLAEAQSMMQGKTPQTVVVAIADAGVDIEHPDLKSMLWTNKKEVTGNGIDDDNNGYVDDIYGWNFLGETTFDNMELTRQYKILNEKYEFKSPNQSANNEEYTAYLAMKKKYLAESSEAKMYFELFDATRQGTEELEAQYNQDKITKETLENHKSGNRNEEIARRTLLRISKRSKEFDYGKTRDELMQGYNQYDMMYNYGYNTSFDPRKEKVGDDYSNPTETGYGNNNVYYGERFSEHGTHVAGIVAANSTNDIGTKGICQSCEIMSIRVVPNGDERDKDVANGIRYAVDNGAKIVNMSFGKQYAQNTQVVYDAIKYAENNNVLLVHAAGNDGVNNDQTTFYPNDNHNQFNNWIEVGACSWQKKPKNIATFSNYGENEVDLFAPGVAIYSTTPENKYDAHDGTSMASPVVAGVAAFVWSYYPQLTAAQLKDILIKSSIPIKGKNRVPGAKKKKCVSELAISGGEVNLPAALHMAQKVTGAP